jgi:Fe-S-cluster containining protein
VKECTQCGKCCTQYGDGGLSVTDSEIDMWELFQPDIAQYVKNGLIWASPETGKRLDHCPFLRVIPADEKSAHSKDIYTCDIYFDRPNDCRYYPVTIKQMINDECEMLEEKDRSDPVKAQKELDILMKDSRPAFDK